MLRKQIIALTVLVAMIFSVLPIGGFVNAAEEEDNTSDVVEITEKNINLGVSAIENSDTENNKWDNIYYGKYGADSLPFKWRVLSKSGNGGTYKNQNDVAVNGNNAMLVIAEKTLGFEKFSDLSSDWASSNAKNVCKTFADDVFSDNERAIVLKTTKNEGALNLFHKNWKANSLSDDELFYISAEEAYNFLGPVGQSEGLKAVDLNEKPVNWGLRSPLNQASDIIGSVANDGEVVTNTVDTVNVAARPAFNLNFEDVLFTSDSKLPKIQETTTQGYVYHNSDAASNDVTYKLTVRDLNRNFAVDNTEARTVKQGEFLNFVCTGLVVGNNEYVSAIIEDKDGNVVYYGQLGKASSRYDATSKQVRFRVPTDIVGGDYTLKLFNEQIGENEDEISKCYTDIASNFVDIKMKVEGFYGSGTEGSPYLIRNLSELEHLSDLVNGGNIFEDKFFKLTTDIDMSQKYNEDTGLSWKKIGRRQTYEFKGVFDGDGHKITGMYMGDVYGWNGLFEVLAGTVKNLGITGKIINTSTNEMRYNGAFAAIVESSGKIYNCWSNIDIINSYVSAGGICGMNYGAIENCYSFGNISGASYVGGIAGSSTGMGGSLDGTIKNCYTAAKVSANKYLGAVVGEKNSYAQMENCYYLEGDVSDKNGIAVTEDDIKNGRLAYILQSNIDESLGLIWGQKLNVSEKDDHPVLISTLKTNEARELQVYKTSFMSEGEEFMDFYSSRGSSLMPYAPQKKGKAFCGWYEKDGRENNDWGYRFTSNNIEYSWYLFGKAYARMSEAVKFDFFDTEYVYKKDTKREISLTPECSSVSLTANDFKVKYYGVDAGNGKLKSTDEVSPVLSGKYLCVVDFANTRYDCGIERKFTVTEETADMVLPNPDEYDNICYMTIFDANGSLYITGANNTAYVDDVFTLYAFMGNTQVETEWESSDTDIAEVDKNGTVTIKKAGDVVITATAGKAFDNTTAEFKITAKQSEVTLTPTELVKTYNGERQDISFTSSNEGFVPVLSGENKNVDVTYTKVTDPAVTEPVGAGTYAVSYIINDKNYKGGGNATLYINKADVEVKPKNVTKIYGEETEFGLETENTLVSEEEISYIEKFAVFTSDGAAKTADVKDGGYEISVVLNKDSNDNFNFKVAGNGTLYINKADVEVKPKDITKVYGEEAEFELETENTLVSEEEISDIEKYAVFKSDGAAKTADVKDGGYEISVVLNKDSNNNFNFRVVASGVLTVAKASLTVKVKDVTRVYGEKNPDPEVSYTGFINEDTKDDLQGELMLSYDESINDKTPVGEYKNVISAEGLSSVNYEITYEKGTVTITKIPVKVSAGTSTSSYLKVEFDKSVENIDKDNFVVNHGEKTVKLSKISTDKDDKTYKLHSNFTVGEIYVVTVVLTSDIYEIVSEPLSIKPVRSGSSGGGSSYGGSSGGGGSVARKYTVTFNSNGGSNVEDASVTKDAKVAKPSDPVKDGFEFVGWYADEKLTKIYDFDTPIATNITLYAKWQEKDNNDTTNEDENKLFDDVEYGDWYFENVKYVVENNLMKGVTESDFAPDEIITRGMFVTVLYRAEGEPVINKSIPFSDVLGEEYYSDAVAWADQNEIVRGVTENNFAPNDSITREQMAVMIYRYTKYKGRDVYEGEDVDLSKYDDFDKISEYAVSALHHVVGIGLMKGKTETTLNPQEFATRAEVAAIIQRFLQCNN